MNKLFLSLSLVLCAIFSFAQNKNENNNAITSSKNNFLQISGVIVDDDSLVPVPFASIYIKNKKRGAQSDYYGFFTIVAQPGDELIFLSINHKNAFYKLEDTLSLKHYFIIQKLLKDTIQLAAVNVYPWPTQEEFKKAFLNLDLTDTDYERAAKNMERTASFSENNIQMDAQSNYRFAMNQYLTKVYTAGQYPTISLLNPLAWAQFIDALRMGKFKKQKPKSK